MTDAPRAPEAPIGEPAAPADPAPLLSASGAPGAGDADSPRPNEPPAPAAPPADTPTPEELDQLRRRPSFLFFGVVASIALVLDLASKAWAEIELSHRTLVEPSITLIDQHLFLTYAENRGGAWGLLQNAHENVRRPFFLVVSLLAIAFIVSLYGRLLPGQRALTWGLPLVLGGALGNLSDRITRSVVIDFIDYRAEWVEKLNVVIAKVVKGWTVTDHWPTFNVADIAICVGVGLMAVDMITSRRGAAPAPAPAAPRTPEEPAAPPAPAPAAEGAPPEAR